MPATEPSNVAAPVSRRTTWWRRPRLVEAAATAIFTIYVAWPFLSFTQYVTSYDTVTYGGPNLAYLYREVKAGGNLPIWNDSIFNGVPNLANPNTAMVNPVKWLFLPLDAGRALELITAANIFILAAGLLFLFSRRLHLRPPAGFIGTAAIVGGGTVMARAAQFEQIAVIAWMPWLLAAIDWAAEQDRLRPRAIAAIAATTGLLLVAGHPNQAYVFLPFAAVWTIVRVADRADRHDIRQTLARLATIGFGAIVGIGLAAIQLLPMAAQLNASVNTAGRSLLGTDNADLILTPSFIATAIVGETWSMNPRFSSGSFEALTFVGITVAILALLGLAILLTTTRRRWTGAGLAIAAVIGVMLAIGGECQLDANQVRVCQPGGRVFRFAFERVPGFDQIRVPGRWLLLTALALAILAAFAVDALVRRRLTTPAVLGFSGLVLASLLAMSLTPAETNPDIGGSWIIWIGGSVLTLSAIAAVAWLARNRGARAIVGTVAVGVVAVLVVLELGGANRFSWSRANLSDRSFTDMGGATSRYLRDRPERNLSLAGTPPTGYAYISNALRPNTNLTFGSRSLDGYDGGPWVTKRWVTAVEPLTTAIFVNDLPLTWQIEVPPNRELLARYGVKYIVVDAKGTAEVYGIPNPGSPESQAKAAKIVADGYRGPILVDGPLQTFENPSFTGEGQVYFETIGVSQDADTLIRKLGELSPSQALVPSGAVVLRCDGACPSQPVDLVRPRPGEIDATVDLKRRGLFVVPEQGASGWSVTVDDNPATIIPVDSMNQGVVLEPGQHTVSFTYTAPGLTSGLVLSVLSLLLIALFGWEPAWLRLPRREAAVRSASAALDQAGDQHAPDDRAADHEEVGAVFQRRDQLGIEHHPNHHRERDDSDDHAPEPDLA